MIPAQHRLLFVGPMFGKHPGWAPSQGEILARSFARDGYAVHMTSTLPNRFFRLADTITTLVRRRHQTDIVLLMVFSGPAFVLADMTSWLAKRIRKPLVLWLHGGDLPRFARRFPIWVDRVLRRGDAIVSPSEYLATHFRSRGFCVNVIPNQVSAGQYPFRQRSQLHPRLLWMRTFHDLYHPQMAVSVVAALRGRFSAVSLTMAGQDRGLLGFVRSFAGKEALQEHVCFPGFLDMHGKFREFDRHDIFLNTSRVDNTPVSLIEAAACGLPIVTTAVGGIPHLFTHEKTALMVEDGDVAGMAAAVLKLLGNPVLAKTLSANGRKLAETCEWARVSPQWETLLEAVAPCVEPRKPPDGEDL